MFFQKCQKCHRIFSKMSQDFFKNDTGKAGVDTGKAGVDTEKAGVDTGKRESTQDFFKNDTGKAGVDTGFFQK
jgi:hypothetical protein